MAKTSLSTNIGYNIARAYQGELQPDGQMKTVNGGIVGFFSLEMSAEQLATRIIAERSGIPSSTIRRGGISETDFGNIRDAAIEIQNLPFYIDETGGLSIAQLAARARRLKRQKGLDLLIVDYIQLLQGSSRKSDNRVQEMTEITTSLKRWRRNWRCRSSQFRSCRVRSKPRRQATATCPTCVNPARSAMTPTSCCSFIARNITSPRAAPGTPNTKSGRLRWSLPPTARQR